MQFFPNYLITMTADIALVRRVADVHVTHRHHEHVVARVLVVRTVVAEVVGEEHVRFGQQLPVLLVLKYTGLRQALILCAIYNVSPV